jgi:hypothetical protein
MREYLLSDYLMNARIFYLFLLFLLLDRSRLHGQNMVDTAFGKITPEDFHVSSPVVDSDASVVVLEDFGQSTLDGYDHGWRVEFKRHRRLLIRNKKGFDAATIILSFSGEANGMGKLTTLRANAYNLDNGKVVQTKVEDEDMFLDSGENERMKERWTFPNVREGSIIEYVYSIYYPSIYNLPSWDFQGNYPRLKSNYTVTFPSAFNYVFTKQGSVPRPQSYDSVKKEIAVGRYTVRAMTYTIHWEMKDVPSFKEEPYMSSMNNYVTGIRFQLSEYTNLNTERREKVMDSWKRLNENLYKYDDFGGIMTTNSHWLRKEVRSIVEDSLSDIEKAKALFGYVRDHFVTTGRSLFSDGGLTLKEIFKARQGSVAEINLLLTALIREAGLTADAVILSTRDNGRINPSYPITENFNYVIVRLRIGSKDYFLDATEPRLGFGRLPTDCYNGYARIVSERPDSVVFQPDSLTEFRFATIFLSDNDAGDGMSGTYEEMEGYYASLDIRNEVADKGENAFFENIRKSYPFEAKLTDKHIDSLQVYDQPVTVRYNFSFPTGGDDHLYFTPMLSDALKENYFKDAERQSPVEMPYTIDDLYVLQMDIPRGYEIEELPKPVKVKLNEGDGWFEYGFVSNGQSLQFRSRLTLKRAFFAPEEYQSLRDFFALVVKKQNEPVVFRKKK